jgi:hypothetical protein
MTLNGFVVGQPIVAAARLSGAFSAHREIAKTGAKRLCSAGLRPASFIAHTAGGCQPTLASREFEEWHWQERPMNENV